MERSLQQKREDGFPEESFTVPIKIEDRGSENASAEENVNWEQNTEVALANLNSNKPLISENPTKIPIKIADRDCENASAETENCAQNTVERLANFNSNQALMSENPPKIPIKIADQDCENASAEENENCAQNTEERLSNLNSNHPLMSENLPKIPIKIEDRICENASAEENKNCAQNTEERLSNLNLNHPLMSENPPKIPIKIENRVCENASAKETENGAQNTVERLSNLNLNHPLMSENPPKIPIKIEDRVCENASAKETENCAQNTVEKLANLISNQPLMSEKLTKSSVGGFGQWLKNAIWPSHDTSLHQKTPKKTVAVVTLEDLTKSVPTHTIRLKLKNTAKDKKPCEPELMFGVMECVDGMFRQAEADLKLEQERAKEALARNVKHLEAIFGSFEQRIRQTAKEVKMKFSSLTLEQQEEFLVFWKAAEEILGIVLDWLCQVFYVVLAKIRQGYVIEKDALKGVFKTGAAMLKDLYFEPLLKFIEE